MARRWRIVWLLGLAWFLTGTAAWGQVSRLPTANVNVLDPNPEPKPSDQESGVSFIDSALPRTQVRLRFDAGYNNVRPDRAEYIFPTGFLAGGRGFNLPEPKVDMQEATSYLEWAPGTCFSVFMETSLRFVNPEINDNAWGNGDMNLGLKWVCFADEMFYLTLQGRLFLPTGRGSVLGTHHVTLEPAVLGNIRLADMIRLEGEFRYWIPLGGSDFSGNILRYGLGLSYGQRSASQIWVMPVVEVVGWTVLDGQALVAPGPDSFYLEDAGGTTIVNAMAGVRVGFGEQADVYLGYGHGLTGQSWFRDFWRVEFRLLF